MQEKAAKFLLSNGRISFSFFFFFFLPIFLDSTFAEENRGKESLNARARILSFEIVFDRQLNLFNLDDTSGFLLAFFPPCNLNFPENPTFVSFT